MFTSGDVEPMKYADVAELTKHDIRTKVWNYLEESKLARFPTPVHNRIPNFEGAVKCGQRVADLPLFASSHTIKVDPDKPLEEIRLLTLQGRKKLLVPSPRLKTGLFNLLENVDKDDVNILRKKSTSEGMKKFSKPVGLESKIKVDLLVVGSTAVSVTGRRLGKGEGYSDLEYAMMKTMGAVDDSVPIVTIVHDCQVFDDLPSRLFRDYDVPVDVIVTPTRVIEVAQKLPRPEKLYWHLLSLEKCLQIPILRTLYNIDKSNNVDVTLLNGQVLPDQSEFEQLGHRDNFSGRRGGWRGREYGFQPRNENKMHGRYERGRKERGGRRGKSKGGVEETLDEGGVGLADPLNIQVTINVNKQNKIVRRNVEATHQLDRVGSAVDCESETATKTPRATKNAKRAPTFAIFVGKIPRKCRVRELQTELSNCDVRPSNIKWRGANGFAFLNFYENVSEADRIVERLQGLKIHNSELKISLANDQQHNGGSNLINDIPTTGATPTKGPLLSGVTPSEDQVSNLNETPSTGSTPLKDPFLSGQRGYTIGGPSFELK